MSRTGLVILPLSLLLLTACSDSEGSDGTESAVEGDETEAATEGGETETDTSEEPASTVDDSPAEEPEPTPEPTPSEPVVLSDEYSFVACPDAMEPENFSEIGSLPDCTDTCGGGKCIPPEIAGEGIAAVLPKCEDGNVCMPETIAATGGSFTFAECASVFDPEGKGACVPYCFAGDQAGLLQQGSCAAGELCAPCVSPLDMQPTGACDYLACPGADDAGE